MVQKIVTQFSGLKYLYFSVDLDGLNPSCAPGVESPYPGGPDINQVIYLIHKLKEHFVYVGMDISELIPKLDPNHVTALSAARILKEFYGSSI
ncbi:Agmatinase (fragment) [Legionella fallonii LLAP-10]|uniref:Agmatinase n=2 Tax=Legionella fallonii TaxID=96230 RepID=A0A098G289_9GAMM